MNGPLALLPWLAILSAFAQPPASNEPDRFEARRLAMADLVAGYDPAHRVADERILAALRKVPRHLFVPEGLRERAYGDGPLPIGHGQTISQPFIVGYMTQLLEPKPADRILEIGTGSGYQAAVLGELAAEVYTVEIVKPLARKAEALLKDLGYKNVKVLAGDGYRGWPQHAPFDAVIVTCAPDHIPEPLIRQLKTGGRMVIPVGEEVRGAWSAQELILVRKTPTGLEREKRLDVRFVSMTGEARGKRTQPLRK